MDICVSRQSLLMNVATGQSQLQHRPVEGVQTDLAFYANNAKLVALYARVPTHVDHRMNSDGVLNQSCRRVLHRELMQRVREQPRRSRRLSEQKMQASMRCEPTS